MSTQNRNSGGGNRGQKKSNSGGGGGGNDSGTHSVKKTDHIKPEKEKSAPKPTAEQLRIAQITNSATAEDPFIREKVATLIEMTQRSEEEVCCALNECDNNLERAVVFLLETLPVGAFETSSKKKKKQAANAAQESNTGDGNWGDGKDRREKSRNRSTNNRGRGAGGVGDNRGWRGREGRENDRNVREQKGDRGDRADRGGDRPERNDRDRRNRDDRGDRDDRNNDNYHGNRSGGRNNNNRGNSYSGRNGRGGGRGGGGRSFNNRGDRNAGNREFRSNNAEDHHEVELWDNTIAQNAEKQQQQSAQDEAWGDWDNEEYVGSLKDSKVFTSSTLAGQAVAAGVVSANLGVDLGTSPVELSAPPGLEQHLGSSVLSGLAAQQQATHLNAIVGSAVGNNASNASLVDENISANSSVHSTANTPLMQYSAAVTSNPPNMVGNVGSTLSAAGLGSSQFNTGADSFSNAASAAATLVQQVQQQQQQQTQLKASATLSAEQSQYFNSLTSQNTTPVQQQQQAYGQNSTYAQTASVQYPATYANVFGGSQVGNDQGQLTGGQQTQVRRARAKLPPPSKIPATAVEMPGDAMNNMGYIDVQFGALDYNNDDSFEAISDKFNSAVTIDGQAQAKTNQDLVSNDYQNKASLQQQQNALAAGLQESLSAATGGGYTARGTPVQQQQVSNSVSSGSVVTGGSALEQLTKNDPYTQNNASNTSYQNTYQTNSNKSASNAYQPSSASAQNYNSSSFTNVQTSAYSQQSYGAYPQNSVNSYQPQTAGSAQNVQSSVSGNNVNSTQNIPGGNASSANVNSNSTSGYLSSGYQTQPGAYQSSQNVYGSSGYSGNNSNSTSQYSNYSTSAKLKESSSTGSTSHYESVTGNGGVSSGGQVSSNTSQTGVNSSATSNTSNNNNSSSNQTSSNVLNSSSGVATNSNSSSNVNNNNANSISTGSGSGGTGSSGTTGVSSSNATSNTQSTVSATSAVSVSTSSSKGSTNAAVVAAATANSTGSGGGTSGGMVPPNIQMVSQYIQTGMPYYQPPVYSFEELQMMQQRVPHVTGYYDLNYTPTSLGTGRDNMGSVAYSTMTDGRFARTDNNSSPVSSTMSQQAGSGGHMLNVPYAYFYNANAMMPGSFQYGTHTAIYPQQLPAANAASGGQFPKPSYNAGYGSASYDTLSQASQDYNKGAYQSTVTQQTKTQSVTNPPQTGSGTDISTSMYGKGHVALNKVNSYEKQSFHSGTPPPFNMANTQTAGGTSAQPYGMYLPMPAAGHHNMMHQQIHQMAGSMHYSSRGDSNSTGQRQQTTNQTKPAGKQGYSPSYWNAGQN